MQRKWCATSWKWHLCKLHNEVFKASESRINIECLPLARGDESINRLRQKCLWMSASRRRRWIAGCQKTDIGRLVCPSQEGMNRRMSWQIKILKSQTLVRGDKTQGEKNMQKHNWKINIVNEWTGEKRCFRYNGTVDETKDFLLKFAYRLAGKLRPTLTPRRIGSVPDFNSCQSVSR